MNPNTATAEVLDPAVRRCVRFAESWGYGAMEVVNIFAWRSTDSWALYDVEGPVGAGNAAAVCAAAAEADLVVAAWGVHGALAGRG